MGTPKFDRQEAGCLKKLVRLTCINFHKQTQVTTHTEGNVPHRTLIFLSWLTLITSKEAPSAFRRKNIKSTFVLFWRLSSFSSLFLFMYFQNVWSSPLPNSISGQSQELRGNKQEPRGIILVFEIWSRSCQPLPGWLLHTFYFPPFLIGKIIYICFPF